MTKLERRRRYWRAAVRRFNAYEDLERFLSRREKHFGEPTWRFLCLVPQLAVLWRIYCFYCLRMQIEWHADQHCCSCHTCTYDKRKWYGNSPEGQPWQERRERLRLAQEERE